MATPAAFGNSFVPPRGQIFHGVSETGHIEHYRSFVDQTGEHSAISQSFFHWGVPLGTGALERYRQTRTRGVVSLSTAPGGEPEVISPEGIARARGDKYMLSLNDSISDSKQIVYIRLFPEMNGHWNPYSAFNADGSRRGSSHSTKNFRKAWKRFAIIVRGGPRAKVNNRLKRLDMPRLLKAKGNNDKIYDRLDVPKKLPKPKVAFIWNPQTRGSPNVSGNQPADYYPGGKYVDWVGADAYAKFSNATLWNNLNAFYRKYDSKPFVIGEYGPWDSDPVGAFVNQMFNWAESHGRARMLIYYRSVSPTNIFNIQFYPAAQQRPAQPQLQDSEFMPIPPEYRGRNELGDRAHAWGLTPCMPHVALQRPPKPVEHSVCFHGGAGAGIAKQDIQPARLAATLACAAFLCAGRER